MSISKITENFKIQVGLGSSKKRQEKLSEKTGYFPESENPSFGLPENLESEKRRTPPGRIGNWTEEELLKHNSEKLLRREKDLFSWFAEEVASELFQKIQKQDQSQEN